MRNWLILMYTFILLKLQGEQFCQKASQASNFQQLSQLIQIWVEITTVSVCKSLAHESQTLTEDLCVYAHGLSFMFQIDVSHSCFFFFFFFFLGTFCLSFSPGCGPQEHQTVLEKETSLCVSAYVCASVWKFFIIIIIIILLSHCTGGSSQLVQSV